MLNRTKPTHQGWGIALLRVVVGIVFLAHGTQKLFTFGVAGVAGGFEKAGFPLPAVSASLVTGVEFLGGLLLILGLFTRWAALFLSAVMLVAMTAVHLRNGFFLPTGFEYTLILLAANVSLVLAGAGAFALDNLLGHRGQGDYSPQRA